MNCPNCKNSINNNLKICPYCKYVLSECNDETSTPGSQPIDQAPTTKKPNWTLLLILAFIPGLNFISFIVGLTSLKKQNAKDKRNGITCIIIALCSITILAIISGIKSSNNDTSDEKTIEKVVSQPQQTNKPVTQIATAEIVPFDQLFIDEKYNTNDTELETTVCVEEISNFYFKASAEENEYNGWEPNDCEISFVNEDDLCLLNVGDYITVYGIYSGGASESIKQAKIIYSGTEALQRFEEEKQMFNEWLDKTYSNRNSVLINDIDTFEFDYLTDDPKYEKVLATDIIKMCETDSENAKSLYADKFLEIKGRVYRNGVSGDQLQIRGSDNHFHLPVICSPRNDTQKLWIMNLQEGDNVIVRCEVFSVAELFSPGSLEANIDDIFTCDGKMSDEVNTVLISYGELGQCGQIDYFDNDPMIRYYLPAGKYSATSTGTQKGTGFFVESVKLHKEDGYDTSDVYEEYHFDENPSVTFELKDDCCVYVFSGTHMEVKAIK